MDPNGKRQHAATRGLQNVARELQRRLEEECAKAPRLWHFDAAYSMQLKMQ
jgi:hypothetical protein